MARTVDDVDRADRRGGAGLREADGRFVLFSMGVAREKDRTCGRPHLPGNGLLMVQVTAEVKPDGEIDIETLRAEASPLADFRNLRQVG
jgi:hypothetical protein